MKNLYGFVALVTLISTSSFADDFDKKDNKDYFFQANLGYADALDSSGVSNNGNGESIDGSIGDTASYGLEFGKNFYNDFALSASFDALPGFSRDVYGNQNGRQIGVFTIDTESYILMLNGYYNLPQFDSFKPYLTAGIGYAENTTVQNEYVLLLFSVPYSSNTTNNFAYKAGLGVKYEINEMFDLDIHYQYRDLGKYQTGAYTYNNIVYGGVRGDLKVNEVIAGIAIKF